MKQKLTIVCLLSLCFLGIFLWELFRFSDGRFHLIFCDVGQGDAILIKTPANHVILVDSGPGNRVLDCLSRHLPFWRKIIDLAILSHPHEDHLAGFTFLIGSYTIRQFLTEKLANKSPDYQKLEHQIAESKIPVTYLWKGDSIMLENAIKIKTLAPTMDFIRETSPYGFIGERQEFASVIPLITYGSTSVLLTGDSQTRELLSAIKDNGLSHVDILQTPHHGSKTGLSQSIIDAIHPRFTVISVGQNNRYNLPNPATITLIEKNDIPFATTRRDGDVEFVSDGEKIWKK